MSELFSQAVQNEETLELYALLNEMFTPDAAAQYRYLSAITEHSYFPQREQVLRMD